MRVEAAVEGGVHGLPWKERERESRSKLSDVGVRGAGRRNPRARGHHRHAENWSPSPPTRAGHLQLAEACEFAYQLRKHTGLHLLKAFIGCGAEILHGFHYFPPASPALVYYLQHLRISSPSTQP